MVKRVLSGKRFVGLEPAAVESLCGAQASVRVLGAVDIAPPIEPDPADQNAEPGDRLVAISAGGELPLQLGVTLAFDRARAGLVTLAAVTRSRPADTHRIASRDQSLSHHFPLACGPGVPTC
jgi:hypothetical protein